MPIPFWKSLRSHFTEIPLEKASTSINPHLELSLRNGRYCLSTQNAIYSYGDLYRNFNLTFQKIHLDKQKIREVLILGFGMGSIPWMLEKTFKKSYRYTGVEADKVVHEWAKKYILPELKSPIELLLADAYEFAMTCDRQYDLIAIDIFEDEIVPLQFDRLEFLERIKALLSPGGLVLWNRIVDTEEFLERTEDFFEKTLKAVFPDAALLDLGVNWMLMNRPA